MKFVLHPKVTASVVAGAFTGALVAELDRHGIKIAADEAADITVLVSAVAGFFMPDDAPAAPPQPGSQP